MFHLCTRTPPQTLSLSVSGKQVHSLHKRECSRELTVSSNGACRQGTGPLLMLSTGLPITADLLSSSSMAYEQLRYYFRSSSYVNFSELLLASTSLCPPGRTRKGENTAGALRVRFYVYSQLIP